MNPTHFTAPTHVGRLRNVAYVNRGRLFGHSMPKAGKWHALMSGRWPYFRALCGESVRAEIYDGDPAESLSSAVNVYEAGKQTVTCQRCLRNLPKKMCHRHDPRPLYHAPPLRQNTHELVTIWLMMANEKRQVVCAVCGAHGYHGSSRVRWIEGKWNAEAAKKWNEMVAEIANAAH